jgi:hypothetical protein
MIPETTAQLMDITVRQMYDGLSPAGQEQVNQLIDRLWTAARLKHLQSPDPPGTNQNNED